MSNEDRNLTEKIPHSGEPVVTEFNKPLVQAYEEGLLKTPETSQDIPQTAEKKKSRKGLIGAGAAFAGLALGGSLFLGLGNNANGGEQAPEPNQPVPTDVAETDPSESEAPADPESLVNVNELPENVVTHGMFELLDRDDQIRMEALDNMSLQEFRAQPEAEQFKFAEFVYRNNLPILEHRMSQNGDGAEFNIEDPTSPEGILQSYNLAFALQTSLIELSPSEGVTYDYETAKKLNVLSTDLSNEGSDLRVAKYDSVIDLMNTSTPYILYPYEVTGSEQQDDGSLIISFTNTASSENSQNVFSKYTFETIDGKSVDTFRSTLEISDSDPRYRQL